MTEAMGCMGVPFFAALTVFLVTRWLAERNKSRFPTVYLHKLTWFLAIVPVEWSILRSKPYLPTILGGTPSGDKELFAPNAEDELSAFYQVQLAYHVHSMVFACVTGAKAEMHIHHIVTVALMTLSDYARFRKVGLVVLLLHDIPDIITYCIKASIQADIKPLIYFFYATLLPTWGYYRLYLLMMLVIYIATEAPLTQSDRIVFTSLLTVLLALHYFWYGQFILMAMNSKKKGIKDTTETEDKYGKGVAGVNGGEEAQGNDNPRESFGNSGEDRESAQVLLASGRSSRSAEQRQRRLKAES